jgi:hypothetical protein
VRAGALALTVACSRDSAFRSGVSDRQFAAFGDQHPFVSIKFSCTYFRFRAAEALLPEKLSTAPVFAAGDSAERFSYLPSCNFLRWF